MEPDFIQRLLRSPTFLAVWGVIAIVGGVAMLFFCYRDLKRYPDAPEAMTLEAAIQRADRGEDPWVKVPTPYVGCTRAFRRDDNIHVPIHVDPLVLAQFHPRNFDCNRLDRSGIVGVIDRAPPRYAQHLLGDSKRVFYRLSTWSGPENDRLGLKMAPAFMGGGIILLALARYYRKRRSATA